MFVPSWTGYGGGLFFSLVFSLFLRQESFSVLLALVLVVSFSRRCLSLSLAVFVMSSLCEPDLSFSPVIFWHAHPSFFTAASGSTASSCGRVAIL